MNIGSGFGFFFFVYHHISRAGSAEHSYDFAHFTELKLTLFINNGRGNEKLCSSLSIFFIN